jgi:hypothetical protein
VERRVLSDAAHPMGSRGCLTLRVFLHHNVIGGNTRGLQK